MDVVFVEYFFSLKLVEAFRAARYTKALRVSLDDIKDIEVSSELSWFFPNMKRFIVMPE
jgi:hypothetical protein